MSSKINLNCTRSKSNTYLPTLFSVGICKIFLLFSFLQCYAQVATDPTVSKESIELLRKKIPIPENVGIIDEDKNTFYTNVIRAGIKEETAKELIKIILERNQVTADLQKKMEAEKSSLNIQNARLVMRERLQQYENQVAMKIASVLTYDEYSVFSVNNYNYEALDKANYELNKFAYNNPELKEKTKEELHVLLYNYYLHRYFTSAYYGYDKANEKLKLAQLRFNFEKKLLSSYNELGLKSQEMLRHD